jgi:hypothetical protein
MPTERFSISFNEKFEVWEVFDGDIPMGRFAKQWEDLAKAYLEILEIADYYRPVIKPKEAKAAATASAPLLPGPAKI